MPPLNQTPNQPNLAATRPARKVVSLSICSWLKKMNRLCRWSAFFKSMCTDFSQRTTAARPRSFVSRLARQKQDGVILPLLIKELLVQHFLKTHFSASPIRSVHSLRYSPFSSKRRLSQPIDCCNVMFALEIARVCSRVSMDCCLQRDFCAGVSVQSGCKNEFFLPMASSSCLRIEYDRRGPSLQPLSITTPVVGTRCTFPSRLLDEFFFIQVVLRYCPFQLLFAIALVQCSLAIANS